MAISKFNYNSFNVTPVAGNALSFNSDADGFTTQGASSMILIKTLTASSSANLTFVNGASSVVLDDTYPVYLFKFINIHPSTDDSGNGVNLSVNFRDGSTAYDATKTTTYFSTYHNEGDSSTGLAYSTSFDVAQGTGVQILGSGTGGDADQSASGEMMLFNPSSTTFVKHFISKVHNSQSDNHATTNFAAGYCNVTAAIDAVQFSPNTGSFETGTIKLYGIADS